jgi:probable rRNA maturation factor
LIVNLQRKIKIETAAFKRFVAEALEEVEETKGGSVSIAFVSDKKMNELNKFFRGKDATTDVLSFSHEPDQLEGMSDGFSRSADGTPEGVTFTLLGDIVISVEQAERQANENKLTLEREIKQLILHGVLHLCGYDHDTDKGEMNERELELRELLKI